MLRGEDLDMAQHTHPRPVSVSGEFHPRPVSSDGELSFASNYSNGLEDNLASDAMLPSNTKNGSKLAQVSNGPGTCGTDRMPPIQRELSFHMGSSQLTIPNTQPELFL